MPKSYSQDLRERVVKTYDVCQNYEQTAAHYDIHLSTVGLVAEMKKDITIPNRMDIVPATLMSKPSKDWPWMR